jgi:putative restriction endonuclease
MPKNFSEVVNNLPEGTGDRSALRALQAWQYLIGKASNRQIIRYKELFEVMDYTDARPLTKALDNIMRYCEMNSIPPITIIVVDVNGERGDGFSSITGNPPAKDQENVFDYQWFKIIPPTAGEFKEAMDWSKSHS